MGVGEDFARFRDNFTVPNETISYISSRYKRITRQLNSDFWNLDSEVSHSLYVGSYGRDTAAKGLSDLDIAFILPNDTYHKYNGYTNNGQSVLLQSTKSYLLKTYQSSAISGDGQVVVIKFTDGITFEILPVFENKDSPSFTYANANGGGSWKVCNPRAERDAIAERNKQTNGNLKLLCRMTRVWKDFCAVPISGMLIDTIAYQFIENYSFRDKSFLYHDYMARYFFDFLSKQDQKQNWWRAPGSGSNVGRSGIFECKARSAYLRANEAIDYNDDNHEWSRRQKWREVFGPLYPS